MTKLDPRVRASLAAPAQRAPGREPVRAEDMHSAHLPQAEVAPAGGAGPSVDDRLRHLAQGWDAAASGYERYFVPRFAPWIEIAVRAVAESELPGGLVVVPCCGTGPEVAALAAALPGRRIVGIDLSPGMVEIASRRLAGVERVELLVGDATHPSGLWASGCAGVVSAFGLQQMHDPIAALTAWVRGLAPGGILSVVFWPSEVEEEGPFAVLRRALVRLVGAPDVAWEGRLGAAARDAGLEVERDEGVTFPMRHDDPATFWDAVTESGPLRALALARGPAFMAEARAAFLDRMPGGPVDHAPRARWVYGRRA